MTAEAQAQADLASAVQSRQRTQIGLAFFSFILIGANDGGLGVLLPSISAYYGISKGTAGLLFPAGALGYLIAAFTSGLLLERLGRRVVPGARRSYPGVVRCGRLQQAAVPAAAAGAALRRLRRRGSRRGAQRLYRRTAAQHRPAQLPARLLRRWRVARPGDRLGDSGALVELERHLSAVGGRRAGGGDRLRHPLRAARGPGTARRPERRQRARRRAARAGRLALRRLPAGLRRHRGQPGFVEL